MSPTEYEEGQGGDESSSVADITEEYERGKARKEKGSESLSCRASILATSKRELNVLLRDGAFTPTANAYVRGATRIFGPRVIDELKKVGNGLNNKSRFDPQNSAYEVSLTVAKKDPTVQRFLYAWSFDSRSQSIKCTRTRKI